MPLVRIAFAAYLVFLACYAGYAYLSAAPVEATPAYVQSIAVLVLLTGVAPFLATLGVLKFSGARGGPVAFTVGLVLGLVVCVAGYAVYWQFVLAPQGGAPAVYHVIQRGIVWGLLQGALAALAARRQT